jgi:hypothetical protein
MSSSLYLDAIAEAKQLKEAAEANAKKAIIEAMAPQIRRLVENELIEGSNNDLPEGNDFLSEVFGLTESDVNNDAFEIDENLLETISSSENMIFEKDTISKFTKITKTFQESASLYNTMRDKDEEMYQKFEIIASNLLDEAKTLRDDLIRIVEGEGSANAVSSLVDKLNTVIKETEKMSTRSKDEVLYELDLSELNLFEEEGDDELDLDVDAPEGGDEEGGDDEVADDDEGLDDEDEDLGGEAVELELDPESAEALRAALIDALGAEEGAEAEEGEEDEDVDEAEELGVEGAYEGDMQEGDEWIEIDEGMLRREIAAMRKLREAPDLLKVKGIAKDMADSWGGKGSGKSGDDFGGGKRGKDPLSMRDKDLNVQSENRKLRKIATKELRNNRNLTSKLTEAMGAVSELQSQLKEMNLFNAKLLYANKLLQNKNMSTRQMRSIVEALDNARSLREVKLLFKTMTESISSKKSGDSLTESTVRRAVGSSSRPTRSASADNSNTEIDRWATLAGLSK